MITRQSARELLESHIKTDTLLQHSKETELVMEALAKKLNHDPDLWAITGLLHDIDFDLTKDSPEKHGLIALQILEDADLPQESINAIVRHNGEMNGNPPSEILDYALRAGETITGLLIATALVRPSKTLEDVKPKSVIKKMKDKRFAANCNRDTIKECSNIGLDLSEFVEIALNALKPHAKEFGV